MGRLPEQPHGAVGAELLEHLFEVSSEGIAVVRLDGGAIIAANQAFCDVIGYPRDEVIGRSPADLGLIDLSFQEKVFAAVEEKRSLPAQRTEIRTKDGTPRVAEFLIDLTVIGGEPLILGFITDVTEQEREAKLLERSEALFRSVAESAVDAIVSADTDGRITFFNKAAERVFGYPASEVLGAPVKMLMPARFQELHEAGLLRVAEAGEQRIIGRTMAVEGRRADGSEFPVEIALSSSGDGRKLFTAIIRDLTERDAAERALRELEVARERQRLLDRMVDAVEKERLRVAMEIHDGPVQHLAAILLRLNVLRASNAAHDFEAVAEWLNEFETSLGEEVAELRSLMSNLIPAALEEHGLSMALADLASSASSHVRVDVHVPEIDRLTPATEIALFRIAQEALANALAHANASRVEIRVTAHDGHLTLAVTDDGSGFDLASVTKRSGVEHFGLSVMRERAEMVGGVLQVRTAEGKGTEIEVRVPRRIG